MDSGPPGRDSPALVLRFAPDATAADRDRLVALLIDFSLLAIQEDDPVAAQVWTAHFASTESRDAARAALAAQTDGPAVRIEAVDIEDDDWARRTQADLPPVTVGRITIAPPWALDALPPTPPGHLLVVIEPSRGFGTGHHQSTRLCLTLLQRLDVAGRSVIDVGTGSGILAIAAARLGAARVEAIDEDPDAVASALENIERNDVSPRVTARVADALSGTPPGWRAYVVTANLTGSLLGRHADAVGAFASEGGLVLVSGFTIDERDTVADAFAPAFEVSDSAEEDGWWAFVFRRRS